MSLIQQTNFSNVVSPNSGGGLSKVQSPLQLIGNANFGSTEQRAFFVEGGDNMSRINETSFSSAFTFDVATRQNYRFITTTSTQGTQSNFREVTIMVKGSNSSAIEYGIYLINLSPTNIANGSGLMDAKLFSKTLNTSASGIVIDSYDFSAEARTLNENISDSFLLFPYVQNPNGANNLTLVNYTLY